MTTLDYVILGGYALMTVIAFVVMGVDKWKAARGRFRISERALLTLCACFGGLGGWTGMQVFRHKLRKPKFSIGVPVMMLLQIVLLTFYFGYWR